MKHEDKLEIAAIVAEAIKQTGAASQTQAHMTDESVMSRMRMYRREGVESPRWVKRFPCRSRLTGATFYVEVQGWRTLTAEEARSLGVGFDAIAETPLEQGTVVNLAGYVDAAGSLRHVMHTHMQGPTGGNPCRCGATMAGDGNPNFAMGGRVPPNIPIWDGQNLTVEWKTWYQNNHFVVDARAYVKDVDAMTGNIVDRRFDPTMVIDEAAMNTLDRNIGTPMAVPSNDPYMRAPAA